MGPKRAQENMELQQVLQSQLLGHEVVTLPGDIDRDPEKNHEGTQDP